MTRRRFPRIEVRLAILLLAQAFTDCRAADNPLRWESEVRAFEAEDRMTPPPPSPVLFVGSSSVRLWRNLKESFPGHTVLGRGIGGSQMAELNHYIDRLVLPYQPRHVLVYEGDNDIASGKSPQRVLADFQFFVQRVRSRLPRVRISYIAIKPSKARWHLQDRIQETNQLVRRYARWTRRVDFVDIHSPMLHPDGRLREDLFLADGLHINAGGYALWAGIVRRHL